MPTAGEKCVKCGSTVREKSVGVDGAIDSTRNEAAFVLTCQCDDLEGPRTPSDG